MKRKILITFLCILAVVSVVMIIRIQFIEPKDNNSKYIELKRTVVEQVDDDAQNNSETSSSKNKEERLNWDKIKAINPDIVGWITIPYADYIDYPVLWNKSDNEDLSKIPLS